MGNTFGRSTLTQVGIGPQVSADGNPIWKAGGVTVDWATVAAVGSDTTIGDIVVPNGEKYLRYGQILARIVAVQQVQTLTVTGTPTGGTVTIQGTRPDGGQTGTGNIAYNSTAAQAQVIADAIFGPNNVTVGGGALPGTALTFTFRGDWNPAAMTVTANGLTGGSSPAGAFTTTTPAPADAGNFGPYDPAATDGRQTLTRGDCFIVNETMLESQDGESNHPAVFDGGRARKAMILMTAGTHSLAAGPTVAEFETAFPRIGYVKF